MQILLCAATEMEISPTIMALSLKCNHRVEPLITGVGLMAATYALTKKLCTSRPQLIIQAGVAGSLHQQHSPADVVIVKTECVGDTGVHEDGSFRSLFDLQLLVPDVQPWQNKKLVNNSAVAETLGLPLVNGVTVNEISTDAARILYYRDSLHVQIESMEGAALHYIGLLEKVPFLQVRSISNFIGERDKSQWKLKEAITNLNYHLQHILTKLETV